jgi:hypothetical protein
MIGGMEERKFSIGDRVQVSEAYSIPHFRGATGVIIGQPKELGWPPLKGSSWVKFDEPVQIPDSPTLSALNPVQNSALKLLPPADAP